uniref:Uncharacterized protein n=1 Tax=Marseillevirus LCMAC101 TaxID=2506602 RepID=A0A481YRC8_9VIRU|nr:MAG: hypothetical protein LCMAC101_04180 [Marseillevirus LCMAC101]
MDEFTDFVVDIKLRLFRHEEIVPLDDYEEPVLTDLKDVKGVTEEQKLKIREFSYNQLNSESFYQWLFYTGKLPGLIFHLLEKRVDFIDHTPVYTIKARYIFPNGCTKKYLRNGVEGIFSHWFRASDLAYILEKFNIVSHKKCLNKMEIAPDIYVNL